MERLLDQPSIFHTAIPDHTISGRRDFKSLQELYILFNNTVIIILAWEDD